VKSLSDRLEEVIEIKERNVRSMEDILRGVSNSAEMLVNKFLDDLIAEEIVLENLKRLRRKKRE
jgi:hypothetical protein